MLGMTATSLEPSTINRGRLLGALHWTSPQVSLDVLSDRELELIYDAVEAEIAKTGWSNVPGSSFVRKERRQNSRGQNCWRWVVYLGEVGNTADVAVFPTQHDAIAERAKRHARWWARRVLEATTSVSDEVSR